MEKFIHEELSYKIIGCAMNVHGELGNGFQEKIYQNALEIELREAGLHFSREHEMVIYYKGVEVGIRRVDFFIEGKILVEIKAVIQIEDVHIAQAKNYLEAYKMDAGLLINFGEPSLVFKRMFPKKENQFHTPENPKIQANPGSDGSNRGSDKKSSQ